MSGNAQKVPIQESANRFAEKKVNDALQLAGKGLPCSVVSVSNSIVTVRFEVQSGFTLPNVTIPMFGGEYIRYPTQAGDKGVVIPFDARLSGVSGIGGGTASLSQPGNLTALVFLPISNTAWSSVDANALTLYGPNGVVLRDTESNSTLILTPSGIAMVGQDSISLTSGSTSITLNNDGSYQISGSSAGSISAQGGLSLSDSTHSTTLPTMHNAFAALITWLNTHTHTDSMSGTTSAPNVPFSGGNIVS